VLDRDDCRGAQLCRAVSRKLHRVQHDRYAGRCVGHRAYEHHMVSHMIFRQYDTPSSSSVHDPHNRSLQLGWCREGSVPHCGSCG